MSINREIDRPSLANQKRGLTALQPLSDRIGYLGHEESRANVWLQDESGRILTEEEAYFHLGGQEMAYQEVIFNPSMLECQALLDRHPHQTRDEVAANFGRELARAHGQGRPVLVAVHWREDGTWHYHLDTSEPFYKRTKSGEIVVDRDGIPVRAELEGIDGHLDRAWNDAWRKDRPQRARMRAQEREDLLVEQQLARADHAAISEQRRALTRERNEKSRPHRERLQELKAAHAPYRERLAVEAEMAAIKASYSDQIKDLWKQERDAEIRSDLLYLRGKGYREDSLEAAAARDKANQRLTTRLNRVDRAMDFARQMELSAQMEFVKFKDMDLAERTCCRQANYERELEILSLRFEGQRNSLLEEREALSRAELAQEMEVILEREEAARVASYIRWQAGGLRDLQDVEEAAFQGRTQRNSLRQERDQALEAAEMLASHLPEDEREAFMEEKTKELDRKYRERRDAHKIATFEERKGHFQAAFEHLTVRHDLEKEADLEEALSRGREVRPEQADRLQSRHLRETARLQAVWMAEEIGILRIQEMEAFQIAMQTEDLQNLRDAKREIEDQIALRARLLPEEDRAKFVSQERRQATKDLREIEHSLAEERPSLEALELAVERRIHAEREKSRLEAFSKGQAWDAKEFEAKADRKILARAAVRTEMRDLRLRESDLLVVAKDTDYKDLTRDRSTAFGNLQKLAGESRRARVLELAEELRAALPQQADRLRERADTQARISQFREGRRLRREAEREDSQHFKETKEARLATLEEALEVQNQRHQMDLEIRRSEVRRQGKEWTPDHEIKARQDHQREARRLGSAWYQIQAEEAGHQFQEALESATHGEAIDALEERFERNRETLIQETAKAIAALPEGVQRDRLNREMRRREDDLRHELGQKAADLRRETPEETARKWNELGRLLGQKQAMEEAAAIDSGREPDEERLSALRQRHAQECQRLLEARLGEEALRAKDRSIQFMDRALGRFERRDLEAQALVREQNAVRGARSLLGRKRIPRAGKLLANYRAEGQLNVAREWSRNEAKLAKLRMKAAREEWKFLQDSLPRRMETFSQAYTALVEAQTIEREALSSRSDSPAVEKEVQPTLSERQAAMANRHEIQQNSLQCDWLRIEERRAMATLRFGSLRERGSAYRLAFESITRRQALETKSLNLKLDLTGASKEERTSKLAELSDRHGRERERLQSAISRTRGARRILPVKGKAAFTALVKRALETLLENHKKLSKTQDHPSLSILEKPAAGVKSAGITVATIGAKHLATVGQEIARQIMLQAQHAIQAAIHTAKSAAIAIVNPMAGLSALGQGLGEVAKDSITDLGKGTTRTAKTLGRDTVHGAWTAGKQIGGGILDLTANQAVKASVTITKEVINSARKVATEAVFAIKSVITMDILGLGKAGLGAGLAVAEGGIGVAKGAGLLLAKKLPMPVDKILSVMGMVPIVGLGVKLVKTTGEMAHGAASALEIER